MQLSPKVLDHGAMYFDNSLCYNVDCQLDIIKHMPKYDVYDAWPQGLEPKSQDNLRRATSIPAHLSNGKHSFNGMVDNIIKNLRLKIGDGAMIEEIESEHFRKHGCVALTFSNFKDTTPSRKVQMTIKGVRELRRIANTYKRRPKKVMYHLNGNALRVKIPPFSAVIIASWHDGLIPPAN